MIAGLMGMPATSSAVELVQDGGFEGGFRPSPWVQADRFGGGKLLPTGTPLCSATKSPPGTPPAPEYCEDAYAHPDRVAPRSGSWWAWFGGYNFFDSVLGLLDPTPHTASLRQTIQMTAGTPATLSFWLWLGRADASSVLNVSLGETLLASVRGDDARYKPGYAQVVVPIGGAAVTGGPQTLSFEYTGVVTLLQHPAINVDDVSLQTADTDLAVGLASTPTTVTRGARFTTTLAAVNAGPSDAGEVSAAYPLPTGATLVGLSGDASCAAPETAPGYVVHCDFGTLPAGATKTVSLTLHATAVGTVAQAASIAHRTGDPDGGNNVAHSNVTVVAPASPPGDDRDEDEPAPTCTSPRRFTVPLQRGSKGNGLLIGKHSAAKSRITSARLTGPKRFKALKLRHTKSRVTLDLRRVPAGRYTVRTRVRVSSKRTIDVTRIYEACGATAKSKAQAKRSGSKSTKSTSAKTKK
ncbi:MAG: DUF11 domain-containing protein [Patulibacter sp.]